MGTGRLARQVLARGCARFTGLDLSPATVARARAHLTAYPQAELLVADIAEFAREAAYDCAYSVLTFCHIADKPRALRRMVEALKPGGRLVLSLSQCADEWLDFGPRRVPLYPAAPEESVAWLRALGCRVAPLQTLFDDADDRVVLLVAEREA